MAENRVGKESWLGNVKCRDADRSFAPLPCDKYDHNSNVSFGWVEVRKYVS